MALSVDEIAIDVDVRYIEWDQIVLSDPMLRLYSLVFLLGALSASGPLWSQDNWNPDYNADGIITSADLTGFLTAWQMPVDSIVKSAWEVNCDAMMEGGVPLDSVEFRVAAMDIQLRENANGEWELDTAWVDQTWVVTNIPVEFNHVRFFGPTPFVTGQVSYHPVSDSYIWYMEFNESLTFTPEDNPLGQLQEEGWFQNLYVFEELNPHQLSMLLPHDGQWTLGPRYQGGDFGVETWTVLDYSVTFLGTP